MSNIKVQFSQGARRHISALKYIGTPTLASNSAFIKLSAEFDSDEIAKIIEGEFVYDDYIITELFRELRAGDIIGSIRYSSGWVPSHFKIKEINWVHPDAGDKQVDPELEDYILCDVVKLDNLALPKEQDLTEDEKDIYFFRGELTAAYLMNHFEILYRDGKVYSPCTKHVVKISA